MKKNIYLLILSFGMLLFITTAFAQQRSVTGTVTDVANGSPLPNVSISVKGTNIRTQSDEQGKFSIMAEVNQVLVFNLVGYNTLEQNSGSSNFVNVQMSQSTQQIGEVIITAMGIQKDKKALGYAAQDIKSSEILKNKNPNIINSLNGKIAGVNITNAGGAPGSSASIVIRGGTSLERDNQPLFVIDGMPMDNSTGNGDNSAFDGSVNLSTTYSNRAMDLNPEDIESISVLKGPAAAALYGLRAAAGAVIITTKKGEVGSATVNFSSRYSTNWVNKLPEQQAKFGQGSYYSGTFTDQTTRSWGDPFASGQAVYDNLGDFFQTADGFDNSISISGGSQTGNFFLSASNIAQTGVVPTTDYGRSTVRFNGEQKVGIFTFGLNSSYSISDSRKTLTGSGLWGSNGSGYMESIIAWPRNDNMSEWLNADGSKRRLLPNLPLDSDVDNPYWIINKNPQTDKTNRFIGNVYTNVKVTDWFDITYRLGLDNYTTTFQNIIQEGSSVKEAWQQGMMSQNVRSYNYVNNNLMLNFQKQVSEDWELGLLLGGTTEDTRSEVNSMRAEKFVIPNFYSLNNAEQKDKYSNQSITEKRLAALYGDFRINYKNLLYLNVTGRNDWSSTLPIQNRSFFYSAYSGSFIFTELMERNSFLSFGKLRASYAEVGKDAPAYQTNTYLFGPELTIGGGFRNSWTRGNDQLKPETTTSFEVGTDLRFFNNKLGLDFTYYINNSRDQILQPRVSNATAYILSYVNTGVIENRGIEITLNATPVQRDNFVWETTLNFSHNKGLVKELPGALPILYVTDVQVGNAKAASFGDGNFMGLSGTKWQTDEDGTLLLNWNTGYPLTSTNATLPVGNREPNFIGGWNNSFTFGNWNVNFLFDFRKGGDVYNGTGYLLTAYGLSKETENRGNTITFTGKALNPATSQYEMVTREVVADEKYYRDIHLNHAPFFIETVNWFRLRSANVVYNLPQSALNSLGFVKGASISVSGNNLLLFTNYSGMDPETSAAGAGVIGSGSVGIDYAGVPNTAGVTFGLNVRF